MTYIRTKLGVVDTPLPNASILKPAQLPLFKGDEQENLLCGGCEALLAKSASSMTMKKRFAAPHQLVIVCPKCHANNVLPFTMMDAEKQKG